MNTKNISNTLQTNKCAQKITSARELSKKLGIKPMPEVKKHCNLFIASLRFGRK
jgi:hypothetical protein